MFTTAETPNVSAPISPATVNGTDCYSDKPQHDVPKSVDLYLNVIAGIILSLSVVANTLVVRGIYLTRYRPLSYLLIANIAVAELIGCFLDPFKLHYATRPWLWAFGKTMCPVLLPGIICCSIVVSSSLAAFSVYGCMTLKKPNRQTLKKIVQLSITMSWLCGLAISIPFAEAAEIISFKLCKGGEVQHCRFYSANDRVKDTYLGMSTFLCRLVIPFVVMVFSYGTLLYKIRKLLGRSRVNSDLHEMSERTVINDQAEERHAQQGVTSMEEQQLPHDEEPRNDAPRNRIYQLERKLRRIIYWMVIIYLVCYAPEHFIFLSWRFGWLVLDHKMVFRKHAIVMMTLPKLLHPIFFGTATGIIQRNFKGGY